MNSPEYEAFDPDIHEVIQLPEAIHPRAIANGVHFGTGDYFEIKLGPELSIGILIYGNQWYLSTFPQVVKYRENFPAFASVGNGRILVHNSLYKIVAIHPRAIFLKPDEQISFNFSLIRRQHALQLALPHARYVLDKVNTNPLAINENMTRQSEDSFELEMKRTNKRLWIGVRNEANGHEPMQDLDDRYLLAVKKYLQQVILQTNKIDFISWMEAQGDVFSDLLSHWATHAQVNKNPKIYLPVVIGRAEGAPYSDQYILHIYPEETRWLLYRGESLAYSIDLTIGSVIKYKQLQAGSVMPYNHLAAKETFKKHMPDNWRDVFIPMWNHFYDTFSAHSKDVKLKHVSQHVAFEVHGLKMTLTFSPQPSLFLWLIPDHPKHVRPDSPQDLIRVLKIPIEEASVSFTMRGNSFQGRIFGTSVRLQFQFDTDHFSDSDYLGEPIISDARFSIEGERSASFKIDSANLFSDSTNFPNVKTLFSSTSYSRQRGASEHPLIDTLRMLHAIESHRMIGPNAIRDACHAVLLEAIDNTSRDIDWLVRILYPKYNDDSIDELWDRVRKQASRRREILPSFAKNLMEYVTEAFVNYLIQGNDAYPPDKKATFMNFYRDYLLPKTPKFPNTDC